MKLIKYNIKYAKPFIQLAGLLFLFRLRTYFTAHSVHFALLS